MRYRGALGHDGWRIGAIRIALETEVTPTLIAAYSAKYASGLYGPFREAVGSGAFEGRQAHLPNGSRQFGRSLAKIALDIEEGADMVMVKQGLLP